MCLERSVDQVVALLAVLKAEAAYLPLDERHPPQRRAYLLRDAGRAGADRRAWEAKEYATAMSCA